jgi:hypothetical protein
MIVLPQTTQAVSEPRGADPENGAPFLEGFAEPRGWDGGAAFFRAT